MQGQNSKDVVLDPQKDLGALIVVPRLSVHTQGVRYPRSQQAEERAAYAHQQEMLTVEGLKTLSPLREVGPVPQVHSGASLPPIPATNWQLSAHLNFGLRPSTWKLQCAAFLLTCGGNAVKSHKGIKACGCPREDSGESIWHEPPHTILGMTEKNEMTGQERSYLGRNTSQEHVPISVTKSMTRTRGSVLSFTELADREHTATGMKAYLTYRFGMAKQQP